MYSRPPSTPQVPDRAFIVRDMMRTSPSISGTRARSALPDNTGRKTRNTNDNTMAWLVGMTPERRRRGSASTREDDHGGRGRGLFAAAPIWGQDDGRITPGIDRRVVHRPTVSYAELTGGTGGDAMTSPEVPPSVPIRHGALSRFATTRGAPQGPLNPPAKTPTKYHRDSKFMFSGVGELDTPPRSRTWSLP